MSIESKNKYISNNLLTYQLKKQIFHSSNKNGITKDNDTETISKSKFKVYNNESLNIHRRESQLISRLDIPSLILYNYIKMTLSEDTTVLHLDRASACKWCKYGNVKFRLALNNLIKRKILYRIESEKSPLYYVSPNFLFKGDLTEYLIEYYYKTIILIEVNRYTNKWRYVENKEAFPNKEFPLFYTNPHIPKREKLIN